MADDRFSVAGGFVRNPGVGVWRVITTAPKKEAHVIAQLEPYGCEIYRPMREKIRKVNGRGKTERVAVGVFPGLLFVRPLCTTFPTFRNFQGINSVFSLGLSDDEMGRFKRVMRRFAISEDNQVLMGDHGFRIGDHIETYDGVWSGIIHEVDDKKRLVLLCTLFGREVKVPVSPDRVRHTVS